MIQTNDNFDLNQNLFKRRSGNRYKFRFCLEKGDPHGRVL